MLRFLLATVLLICSGSSAIAVGTNAADRASSECIYMIEQCNLVQGEFSTWPAMVVSGKDAGRNGFYVFSSGSSAKFYQISSNEKAVIDGSVQYAIPNGLNVNSKTQTAYITLSGVTNLPEETGRPSDVAKKTVTLIDHGDKMNDRVRGIYERALQSRYNSCVKKGNGSFDDAIKVVSQKNQWSLLAPSDYEKMAKSCNSVPGLVTPSAHPTKFTGQTPADRSHVGAGTLYEP